MPMTSHGHGAHSHTSGLEAKKGMVAAAGVVGLSADKHGVDKHQQNQKLTPTTPTVVVPPNPLYADGERCKARVPAKVPLTEINQFLICQLCFGYLVDATAIIECQHAFCKSCILKYLENKNNSYCPICEVQLNEAKPHSSLRSDEILQKLVYKLVPGLFVTEVRRRRDFLNKSSASAENNGLDSAAVTENANGESTKPISTPKNGAGTVSVEDIIASMDMKEDGEDLVFLSPEDSVSLSLEYFKSTSTSTNTGVKNEGDSAAATKAQVNVNAKTGTEKQSQKQSGKDSTDNAENKMKNDTNTNAVANAIANANAKNTCSDNKANDRRYLQCPAAVSVGLLKKFIRMKYGLSDDYRVDLLYNGDRDSNLENDLTLLDLALIFKWKKATPMCFHYRIYDRPFKPTNTRPGSKRPFSSLMDQEPPNDDDDAASTGPPNKSPAHGKLTRFAASSSASDGRHGTESGTGKTQPKNRSASIGTAAGEQTETKAGVSAAAASGDRPKEDSMKFRALSATGRAGLINLEDAIEESKVKPKLSADAKPFIVGGVPCGQKLSVVLPKVPPLIVTSPPRSDPSSPLKISFGHVSTSPSSKSSSGSPEGKTHHHHHRGDGHHHHHHKHHRHHKEKHRKHSKNKSKDRDKEKGSSSSSSDKAKHKEKKKEEKAKAQQAAAASATANATATAGTSQTDTKEKETRYKYNAHPNPSQSQTISVKSGKYPPSLLTPASGSGQSVGVNAGAATNMAANANLKQNTAAGIGKVESIVNKKIAGQNTNAVTAGPGAMPMKKSAGIFPERRASMSSTASSSSQASLTVSMKPKQASSSSSLNNAPGSKEGAQQQQQRNIVLPDSVHLQVPKSVTLIPVNPNSGQVLSGGGKQQRTGAGNQQQQGAGGRLSSGGAATTFTHPLTNKSLHQITVTEVPPPTSKSSSSGGGSVSGSQAHKQFNGPGSMEITKIYCDKSSSNSTTKVFDPQGKKLKGLDISISNASAGGGSARGSGEQGQGQSGGKNSITLSKTGLPKIPGVSILPQSMAKSGKLPKNSISMHAMSISGESSSGGGLLNKIKEKHIQQQQQGHGHGPNNNRLSITTIQQQQSLLKIPLTNDNRKAAGMAGAGMNTMRRSSSPHSGAGSGTPPRKFQQQQRITPSPPSKLGQLLHSSSQDQMITAKMINRRSSIEITPVSSVNQKSQKIKRPFESTFNNSGSGSGSKAQSGSASPPGKREKVTGNLNSGREQQKPRTKRESECPLDLSGKSSRSTPPASSSDYDSSNSSFSTDRPATPNISITAQSPPNHKPGHVGKSSGKSHNVHGTQTISSIAQTLTQKQQQHHQQQQQQQQHAKEQKASSGNRDRDRDRHAGAGGLPLSPPIISPSSLSHHSPNSGAAAATSPTAGFHPLGNLLTLSNAAAHLRKMNHHNHPLNNLAVAAAAGAGGFCPNLLRPPMPQQHSPSSQCLNSLASPPISPNAMTSSGLLSHFNHHQMSMSNLMNSPLMQMNSAAAAAAASLLDPTSPASLFCARMGFPQPNPSSPLNPNTGNPFFPSLTRPPHSSPSAASSALRIPNVVNAKSGHATTTKSPPISHNSSSSQSSQSSKSHSHSPKSSSSSGSGIKPLKINGNMSGTSTFVAPSSITPMTKSQTQSAKSAIPNSMKISNFLPTTKSTSSNTNATITSSCGDYESMLMPELILGNISGIGTKTEIGASVLAPSIKPEPQPTSCEAKAISHTSKDSKVVTVSGATEEAKAESQPAVGKKVQKPSTNVRYVCLPGGKLGLVPAKAATENEQLVAAAAVSAAAKGNYVKGNEDESTKLLSSKSERTKTEQEAVITKLHDDEKDAGRLGALGIALGLVPRERERDEKEQVPLLSLTGTSSCASALQTTTTTTMGRTTQQQNLAVRHIPNPSLIFSRNLAAPTPANANVTANNQIPSPTTTKTETEAKVKDEGEDERKREGEKEKDKCMENEINKESKPKPKQEIIATNAVTQIKLEASDSESECSDSKAVVADLVNEVSKLPVTVTEADAEESSQNCKIEIEIGESANVNMTDTTNESSSPESSIKGEEVEISKNIDGIEDVVEDADAPKEEIKAEAEESDESTLQTAEAEVRQEEDKICYAESAEENEDKVDASSISFGIELLNEDVVEDQSQASSSGTFGDGLCTPLENEENHDVKGTTGQGGNVVPACDDENENMECEGLEFETEAANDAEAEVGDDLEQQPDHENALVMLNDDDDDDDNCDEEETLNALLKEDSSSVDADAYAEGDDEANSNRTTEDSTSCDDELMEIDSTEPPTEPENESDHKEEASQGSTVNFDDNVNLEPTNANANAMASVLLSVEDLVTQVENDNNNTIAVFPNLDNHNEVQLQLEDEVPMEIDEFDGDDQDGQGSNVSIPDIVVTESEDVPVPVPAEAGNSIPNGSSLSPPPFSEESTTPLQLQLPSVLAPLSVVTISPSPLHSPELSSPLPPSDNSPSGSSRPNSLPIANSPSPINKLAYLKSGSCSPVSPSSVKSGEHNLRKIENLEKVAAGLLATATNINNNTISAGAASPTVNAGGGNGVAVVASANCDLSISATAAAVAVQASDSSSMSNVNAASNTNSSLQQPPVSNV